MTRVEKALTGLRMLALVCAAFALFAVGFCALQAREMVVAVANDSDMLTSHAVDRLDDLEQPTEELRHVLLNARLASDNLNKAAIDERMYMERELPATADKFNEVLDAARTSITALQPVSDAAARTLDETTARLQGLAPVEQQAASVLHDADVVVNDPHIRESLASVDTASASIASTAKHLDETAADTQTAVHRFLHPTWPTRIVNWAGQAVHAAGGWF